jgi:hypothetical protein
MARKKQSSKKSNKDKSNPGAEEAVDGFILVDPARCRFQHSRIRPQFSGCGRDVVQVLEDIKSGKTNLQDLPPIQVLVGSVDDSSDDDDGSIWYFSLNNRRLWILKQLRDGGYLEEQGNKVKVRVRKPKSQSERERYSISNCALNAKIMVEKPKKKKNSAAEANNKSPSSSSIIRKEEDERDNNEYNQKEIKKKLVAIETTKTSTESDDDDDDDSDSDNDNDNDNDKESRKISTTTNYFGSMVIDSSSSDDDDDDDD